MHIDESKWEFMLRTMDDEVVLVDLLDENDWNELEPFRCKSSGNLCCTLGREDKLNDRRVNVANIWVCREDEPFNGKLRRSKPMSMEQFVSRYLDAGLFHGMDEDEVLKRKKELGVCKKKFVVRHEWTVAKNYEVEAITADDARSKIRAKVDAGDVCVWTDGYEATDKERVYLPDSVGKG